MTQNFKHARCTQTYIVRKHFVNPSLRGSGPGPGPAKLVFAADDTR